MLDDGCSAPEHVGMHFKHLYYEQFYMNYSIIRQFHLNWLYFKPAPTRYAVQEDPTTRCRPVCYAQSGRRRAAARASPACRLLPARLGARVSADPCLLDSLAGPSQVSR